VRTYASDVAKLTGKPLPRNVQNVPAPARPVPPPPPAKVIPKAPSTDEKRDEVLARLKAKAAPTPSAPLPTAAPAVVVPKAPSTDEKKEEVLARLRARTGEAAAPTIKPAPTPTFTPPPGIPTVSKTPVSQGPSPIHTYKTDFAGRAARSGASPISVLAQEQDAGGVPAPAVLRPPHKRTGLIIAGGAILLIAGGTSIFFAYQLLTGHPAIPVEPFVPSLIFADERDELTGGASDLASSLVSLESHSLPEGGVAVAYLTYATTTGDGKTTRIPAEGGALIAALGLPAPDLLLRNVEPASTVGVIHAGGEVRPFFLLKVASYERTFAGMLSWEPTMNDDLLRFYPPYPSAPVATTTASSTPATSALPLSPEKFIDEVVDNHDARALKDAMGRTLLLYGYRDKETLIIARNEAAFSELLSRLAASGK
jgi:hypothetical protein